MHAAYTNIFTRCGVQFRPVEADSGAIGGSTTHEFMVLADSGEQLFSTVPVVIMQQQRKGSNSCSRARSFH
ncbi:hypothetical protein N752_02550 [Desulforamulus aquiferis]|nr:hypothetical protein N752_02550 [Desulforamulus aquiferis]